MNKKIFLGIGIFWLVIILAFVAFKEFTLKTGEEVMLKTRPVDPRDLFRGDYVILNYVIGGVDVSDFKEGDTVYVELKVEDGYGDSTGVYRNPPEGLFIKGTVKKGFGGLNVEYGIESYFVPEGEGWEIQRQSGRGLEAKVAIDKFGNAVIKSIFLGGEEVKFNRDDILEGAS